MRSWVSLILLLTQAAYSYGQSGFIEGPSRLAYWTVGHKQEIVIVLHGGPGTQHQYLRPEFDALTKIAQVVYYDQRGCGKSQQATTYLWQDHVDDLNRLVQTVAKQKKVFLVGSSWGSTLAILYAYRFPKQLKGLILSGTYRWPGIEGVYKRTRRYVANSPVRHSLVEQRRSEGKTTLVIKEVETYSGTVKEETIESTITAPRLDSLKKLRVPVLIVNGTRDCGVDWGHEYVKVFPQAELYTVPDACHDPWLSNPTLFFSRSVDFIRVMTPK